MTDLSRRELLRRGPSRRAGSVGHSAGLSSSEASERPAARVPERLPTLRGLRTTLVKPSFVGLAWTSPVKGGRREHDAVVYEVFRNGRRLGTVSRHAYFSDHNVKPQHEYRYQVRARVGRLESGASRVLVVRTPAPPRTVAPEPTPVSVPPTTTPVTVASSTLLTQAQVDRMFWRAGFGPSDADRAQWTGQPLSSLVSWFLNTPYALGPENATAPTYQSQPIDPLASDPELQMEWLDRMVRVTNPFIERMNLFWHGHWPVSKDSGIPSAALIAYRNRLQNYSDFGTNPGANFHDLCMEMTTQDAAMSQYLTAYLNVASAPNENYAREFMELFCLGVTNAAGQPNYSQTDVHQLARAFTGYTLNSSTGTVTFNPKLADSGVKTILGQTGNFNAASGVSLVLSQPAHAPFLVGKLWSEFIAAPIPDDTLASLVFTYTNSGFGLAPLLEGILSHPLIFDSLDEPTMVKSPTVFTVGVLRRLGAPLTDTWQTTAMSNMQQQLYHPPNVGGWPGGLSWLTTGTAVARYDLIVRCQSLLPAVADVPGESASDAYSRAYATAGSPWLSPGTVAALQTYAAAAPALTAAQRIERQYALVAFMLGGPDGQVM